MADPEIEQLKELVRQNIALTQENARILRGMRNASRFKSFMWWLVVLISIGVSVWSYYTFVEPRVQQIQNIYQTNIGPLQGAYDFIKNFGTSTKPQ